MKKLLQIKLLLLLSTACIFCSCHKVNPGPDKTKCAHATDGLIVKKWASVSTQIDDYNASGVKQKTSYDYPAGYLQFSSDNTYSAVSDGLSVNGKWSFDTNCNLGLDMIHFNLS